MPGASSRLRSAELLATPYAPAEGLDDRAIARQMGISRTRVYQLRLRAIRKLRQAVLADPVLRTLAEEVCGRTLTREGDSNGG